MYLLLLSPKEVCPGGLDRGGSWASGPLSGLHMVLGASPLFSTCCFSGVHIKHGMGINLAEQGPGEPDAI